MNITAVIRELESSIELAFLSINKKLMLRNWLAVTIANVAAWFFEREYANPSFDSLGIRLAFCSIGLPLVLAAQFNRLNSILRYQKLYLFSFFTILLPFMFGFIGLMNAANTPAEHTLSSIWIFEYMTALFLFYGLLARDQQTLVICFSTHLFALFATFTLSPINSGSAWMFSIGMLSAQFTIFAFATLTHRRLNFVNQQKIEAAYAIGSRVAHEIRTPLLTINHLTQSLDRLLDIEDYELERESRTKSKSYLEKIRQELRYTNTTIDMLLVSTSAAPFRYDKNETFRVSDCVKDAVRRYPYANSAEKDSVTTYNRSDFIVRAPQNLICHVLLNLLKNSIRATSPSKPLRIEIEHGQSSCGGYVRVRDNGVGIPKNLESRVFENFFTTRETGDGTGLGLAFCSSVMSEIGGKIELFGEKTQTDFVLTFPSSLIMPNPSPPESGITADKKISPA